MLQKLDTIVLKNLAPEVFCHIYDVHGHHWLLHVLSKDHISATWKKRAQ